MSAKQQRLSAANDFILAIASYGRRFFWSGSQQRLARIEMDARGRLWWVDDYTGQRIYMHTPDHARWRGFTHGGTLRSLACCLRDYVMRGHRLSSAYFSPDGSGRHWGYGNDILRVRAEGIRLGVILHAGEVQP